MPLHPGPGSITLVWPRKGVVDMQGSLGSLCLCLWWDCNLGSYWITESLCMCVWTNNKIVITNKPWENVCSWIFQILLHQHHRQRQVGREGSELENTRASLQMPKVQQYTVVLRLRSEFSIQLCTEIWTCAGLLLWKFWVAPQVSEAPPLDVLTSNVLVSDQLLKGVGGWKHCWEHAS